MGYYNSIFTLENNIITYLGSCDGGDTPSYFDEVKTLYDFQISLSSLRDNNAWWSNLQGFPFPWKTYKTNDWNIVAIIHKKRWWEFAQKVDIYVDYKLDEEDKNRDNNFCSFIPFSKLQQFQECEESDSEVSIELLNHSLKIQLPNIIK